MNEKPNQLSHLLPRHLEIMRRLTIGQKQGDIANDMGMSQSRMSIIVNSPLFQLELKRLQHRREEKIFQIQEELIDAGLDGVKLHKETITDKKIDLDLRLRSATAILNIVGRVTKSTFERGEDETEPYERRLKEIIFREEVTVGSKPAEQDVPHVDGEDEELEEDDLIEGESETYPIETGVESVKDVE